MMVHVFQWNFLFIIMQTKETPGFFVFENAHVETYRDYPVEVDLHLDSVSVKFSSDCFSVCPQLDVDCGIFGRGMSVLCNPLKCLCPDIQVPGVRGSWVMKELGHGAKTTAWEKTV